MQMEFGEGVDVGAVLMRRERASPAGCISVRVVVELDFLFEIAHRAGVGAWAWCVDGVWGPAEGAVGGYEVVVFDDEFVVCCCGGGVAGVCAEEVLAPEDAADAGCGEGLGDVVDCAVGWVFVGWGWHLAGWDGQGVGSAACWLRGDDIVDVSFASCLNKG